MRGEGALFALLQRFRPEGLAQLCVRPVLGRPAQWKGRSPHAVTIAAAGCAAGEASQFGAEESRSAACALEIAVERVLPGASERCPDGCGNRVQVRMCPLDRPALVCHLNDVETSFVSWLPSKNFEDKYILCTPVDRFARSTRHVLAPPTCRFEMTSKLLLAVGAATASVGLPWLCGKLVRGFKGE
jgi:hypothetical protein